MDTQDKGVIPTPRGAERDWTGLLPAAHNTVKYSTRELFISEVFHVVFSDCH